jgi:hypothetical protein
MSEAKGLILPGYQAAIYSLEQGVRIAKEAARQAAYRMDMEETIEQERIAAGYDTAIELLRGQLQQMLAFQRGQALGGSDDSTQEPVPGGV